jgi:formylglycine-generating enzyme required for sulfatase activity
VIDEARDAAARVVSSVQQEQRDDKERLETEELRRRLAARRAEWDRRLGPMLAVPAGTFEMGADEEQNNEKPVHKVSVAAFELDESEVSVAAWQLCVGAGRCTSPATGARCNWGQPERRGHPINCVDWAQASAFCDWAAKRLPTEEEWEYAVRLGSGASYPWGKGEPSEPLCWRREESGGEGGGTCLLAEVQYDATPLRVRGMAGNVHEWTSSAYCPYTRKDCDAKARVLRGGSWRDRESHALRAMTRMYKATDFQADDAGLRCARNAL